MPRTIPEFKDEFAVGVPRQEGWHTIAQEIEQITPMMGGGWKPLETEEMDPVRIQAIRGHLRFWWRATRSAHYTSAKDMLKDEVLLWGSTKLPSAVQVRVEVRDNGKLTKRPVDQFKEDLSCIPTYVGFPMPNSKNKVTKLMPQGGFLWEGLRFHLVLTFPIQLKDEENRAIPLERMEPKAEVEAALWAWLQFGGLGARTRRGCGALTPIGQAPEASALWKAIEAGLNQHVRDGDGPPEGVASLVNVKRRPSEHLVLTRAERDTDMAWRVLVRQFKEYRQARRTDNGPTPGRSYWCEPDELRRLTGLSENRHRTPVNQVRKAPRAAFGLPIVFHFKDEKAGDPTDHTLQGENHDRLSSPLILRPVRVKGGAVGLAMRLRHDCSQGLVPSALGFKGRHNFHKVGHELLPNEMAHLKEQANLDKTKLKLDHADPITDFLKQLR